MGLILYLLPPALDIDDMINLLKADMIMDPDNPDGVIVSYGQVEKKFYFIIDDIDINYINVNNVEKIKIIMTVNIYETYQERLLRNNLIFQLDFSVEDLINKNLSENLWNKCYIKLKELLLIQNTQILKESLNLNDNDTIPSQYQYLLDIEDHFN